MQPWVIEGEKAGAAKRGRRLTLQLVLNRFVSTVAGEMLPMGPRGGKKRQQQEVCWPSSLAAASAVPTAPAGCFFKTHFGEENAPLLTHLHGHDLSDQRKSCTTLQVIRESTPGKDSGIWST